MDKDVISVKRVHGLGNLIFLLPVLDHFYHQGYQIELFTNIEWHDFIITFRPKFILLKEQLAHTIDLDDATKNMRPQKHRTIEFCELLGSNLIANRFILTIPNWGISEDIKTLKNYIIIAPTAGHKARQWPEKYIKEVCEKIYCNKKIILVGTEKTGVLSCFLDLRQKLSLLDLVSVICNSDLVISMDSGVLHLANALQKPTLTIFSGINPIYRVSDFHQCIVLQANLDCCPCNKNEICNYNYDCLKKIKPSHVIKAIDKIKENKSRTIWRIEGQ